MAAARHQHLVCCKSGAGEGNYVTVLEGDDEKFEVRRRVEEHHEDFEFTMGGLIGPLETMKSFD